MQIELPGSHAERLQQYCHKVHVSESEIICQALIQFLSAVEKPQQKLSEHAAFGCWHDKKQEGLKYQQHLRDEWPDDQRNI